MTFLIRSIVLFDFFLFQKTLSEEKKNVLQKYNGRYIKKGYLQDVSVRDHHDFALRLILALRFLLDWLLLLLLGLH